MWYFLLVCIVIFIGLDTYTIVKGKPTRKFAFKRCVNNWIYQILGFGILFSISLVWILAIVGNQILAKSADINCIIIANGLSVTFEIIMVSFLIVVALDGLNALVRKKKLQVVSIYYSYIDKLDKQGFFKYTDDEKKYNEAEDIKSKAQLRRWFPFIKRLDKKV